MDKKDITQTNKVNIQDIALIGVFSALVLVSSRISIPLFNSRVHLGNIVCLLAGFMLNPLSAGLSAGLGSFLYDIIFYGNGFSCLITFVNKFVMAYVTSIIYGSFNKKRSYKVVQLFIASGVGEIAYIFLYLLKTYIEQKYFVGLQNDAINVLLVSKAIVSCINAGFSIFIANVAFHFLRGKTNYRK